MNLPHSGAALADLTGRKLSDLPGSSPYTFSVRPQQIVTMHFTTTSGLPEPEPITSWDAFVPEEKLPALHHYDPTLIGHPPFGT
jgi:alpha-mannosidase